MTKNTPSGKSRSSVSVWMNDQYFNQAEFVLHLSCLTGFNHQTVRLLDLFHYHISSSVVNARQTQ